MAVLTSVLLVAVTTVALASASAIPMAKKPKCPCHAYKGQPSVAVCEDRSVKSIPDCVASNVTLLHIKTASIPLAAETFKRFSNLSTLKIQLSKPKIEKDVLKYLWRLENFEIAKSSVDYVDAEWFMYAPRVKTVTMSSNSKLTSLEPDTFRYLPLLEKVYLNNNKLTSLPPQLFANAALKTLYLTKNPWNCDCELATFVQWTKDHGVEIADKSTCLKPKKLKGRKLSGLNQSQICTPTNTTSFM